VWLAKQTDATITLLYVIEKNFMIPAQWSTLMLQWRESSSTHPGGSADNCQQRYRAGGSVKQNATIVIVPSTAMETMQLGGLAGVTALTMGLGQERANKEKESETVSKLAAK
jgi:hypothetical protein